MLASELEAAATAAGTLIGHTVDGFSVEGVIGGGSFGTVYRARQVGLDRPVALKVPTQEIASDPVMAKRFAREAKAAARISHPGVVAIYAVGELPDGRPYLAMQLIEGEPLDKILADGALPVPRALHIVRDIASALSETHAADVVHRDLKPSNIVWRRDRNGDDRITLVDFGIAVAKPGNADATRLTANGLIGTPHYMSPEQAQGEIVDARADLYALGCLLFELVTGKPPFDGSGFEVLLAHMGRPIPTPSEHNPDVPESVDRLVRQLLAKKPEDRLQSADEVVAALDEILAGLTPVAAAASHGASARTTRAPRTKRSSVAPTQLDRPTVRPRSRARTAVLAIAALAALSAVALAAFGRSRSANDGGDINDPSKVDDAPSASVFTGRREVIADDGEMVTRATLYDPIVAGTRTRTMFEVWTKLGAPFEAHHLVVTIEGPGGTVAGISAQPSKREVGRYAFWHVFPVPGRYVVRVFPPTAVSMFTFEIDVEK